MNFKKIKFYLTSAVITVGLISITQSLHAVVFPNKKQVSYSHDIKDLKPSLKPDVIDQKRTIKMSSDLIQTRIKGNILNPEIEAISIKIPKNKKDRMIFAGQISKDGYESKVLKYLNEKISSYLEKHPEEKKSPVPYVKLDLDTTGMKIIKLSAIAREHEATTHDLKIKTKNLSSEKKSLLAKKIKHHKTINVKRDLLPSFAAKMADRYVVYKGPNCFHAALAFQGEDFAKANYVNIKKQVGYHDYMINYDELWDSINHYFYEINPKQHPLKYGDMIVFFDLSGADSQSAPHYTWIKHTSSYLFDNYTFSKGSKSANTPYTIKTLEEEWDTWHKYIKKIGIKVFRKNNKYATKSLPKELNEWIY